MCKGGFQSLRLLLGSAALALILTVGLAAPSPFLTPAFGVEPNEVIVYEHVDFVGQSRSFKIEPGMRMRQVPVLDGYMIDRISSIEVGANVEVMVFEHEGFRDTWSIDWLRDNPEPQIYNASVKVLPENMNDNISSLIVFPRNMVAGVKLRDLAGYSALVGRPNYVQFFPLPESVNETEARYPTLGPMNDSSNTVILYPDNPASPGYGKTEVTLYENPNLTGRQITLPGAESYYTNYTLGDYQFENAASSLIVRLKPFAPMPPDPYEVRVYEHADYVGASQSWNLEPGMRQKLVPYVGDAMNDVISSIRVGANVAVAVYEHGDFGGRGAVYSASTGLPESMNDAISSLIIHPKQLLGPIGATLIDMRWDGENHQFFPAAEALDEAVGRYQTVGAMNDDANRMLFRPSDPLSPAYHKLEVALYEHANFQGKSITLPGADGAFPAQGFFEMHPYQFDDTASSLEVRWKGGELAGIMSLPSPGYSFYAPYEAVSAPAQRMYPVQSKPIGVGSVARGGGILSLSVQAAFDASVDVYLAISYLGAMPPFILFEIFVLRLDGNLQRLADGLIPWRVNVTSVDEKLFGDLPLSFLLTGQYDVYLLVVPTGQSNANVSYLWRTGFFVPAPLPLAWHGEQDTDRWGMDYRSFTPSGADPKYCEDACKSERNCRAYTYVRPTPQEPMGSCWLKAGVPNPLSNPCCVSGVKP